MCDMRLRYVVKPIAYKMTKGLLQTDYINVMSQIDMALVIVFVRYIFSIK